MSVKVLLIAFLLRDVNGFLKLIPTPLRTIVNARTVLTEITTAMKAEIMNNDLAFQEIMSFNMNHINVLYWLLLLFVGVQYIYYKNPNATTKLNKLISNRDNYLGIKIIVLTCVILLTRNVENAI